MARRIAWRERSLRRRSSGARLPPLEDLAPCARFQGDPHDAGTRELVYCVHGSVSCGPADQPLELSTGDTGYFDGTVAHIYAAGPDGGRALLVMSYPLNAA